MIFLSNSFLVSSHLIETENPVQYSGYFCKETGYSSSISNQLGGGHLLTIPLPCRKCHYSLIVQPHAVLQWRRANTTRFWFLPLCYNFFFFLLFQSLPEGFTFTVSLWSLCIPSPGFFPIMETGIGADLLLHWFHHLKKCLCAQ